MSVKDRCLAINPENGRVCDSVAVTGIHDYAAHAPCRSALLRPGKCSFHEFVGHASVFEDEKGELVKDVACKERDGAKLCPGCTVRRRIRTARYAAQVAAEEAKPSQLAIEPTEIARRFQAHGIDLAQTDLIATIRREFVGLAFDLANILPPGREAALVFTKLEEAEFFAVAAVARPAPEKS